MTDTTNRHSEPLEQIIAGLCLIVRGEHPPALGRTWSDADWLRLVDVAQAHGMAGLLHAARADTAMPAVAHQRLQAHVYRVVGHNLRLYRSLSAALAVIDRQTPLLILKGAALGPSIYPQPALRPLSDIDLLAAPAAIEAIVAALTAIGLRKLPGFQPDRKHSLDVHHILVSADQQVTIEVHWSLATARADRRAAPLDWFWAHTRPWQAPPGIAATPNARQLDPTAAMLYQAGHLVLQHGHQPARLIWLYDLHLLAAAPDLDWDALIRQARTIGWAAELRVVLEATQRCFGTPLPLDPASALPERLDPRVPFLGPAAQETLLRTAWSDLHSLNTGGRLRTIVRAIAPNPTYLRSLYEPRWGRWWPLAYPYRWLKPLRALTRPRRNV